MDDSFFYTLENNIISLFVLDSTPSEYCQSGLTYAGRGQYDLAIRKFTQGAHQNHAESQFRLGMIYKIGFGLDPDPILALYWFKKSLNNGYLDAGLFIGCTYYHGSTLIPKNYKNAIHFLKDIRGTWEDFSSDMIGNMYFEGGYGIEKDYSQALSWFLKNHISSNVKNSYTIGVMYVEGGFGLKRDFKAAESWFIRIYSSSTDHPFCILGMLYFIGGNGIERNYQTAFKYWSNHHLEKKESNSLENCLGILYTLRDDDEQDFKKAMECFKKTDSHFLSAGIFYEKGLGVKRDNRKAIEMFEKVPQNQKECALVRIGLIHQKNLDFKKAFDLYETASKSKEDIGRGDAMACLGVLYQHGLGVPMSHSKALEYFRKSVDLKSLYGYNCMGDVYKYGCGVDINYEKAFQWYLKSVNCYDPTVPFWETDFKLTLRFCDEGWLNIGIMYLDGLGTDSDKKLAWFYLQKALKFGNEAAQNYIDRMNNDPSINTTTFKTSSEVNPQNLVINNTSLVIPEQEKQDVCTNLYMDDNETIIPQKEKQDEWTHEKEVERGRKIASLIERCCTNKIPPGSINDRCFGDRNASPLSKLSKHILYNILDSMSIPSHWIINHQ